MFIITTMNITKSLLPLIQAQMLGENNFPLYRVYYLETRQINGGE